MDDCDPPYLSAVFAEPGPSGAEPKTRCLHQNRRTLASLSGEVTALGLTLPMKALFQVIRLAQPPS